MQRHVLTHTAEKKHACLWCPYRSNIDSNLRKHCLSKHNEEYPPKVRQPVSSKRRTAAKRKADASADVSVLLDDDVSDQHVQLCTLIGGQSQQEQHVFYMNDSSAGECDQGKPVDAAVGESLLLLNRGQACRRCGWRQLPVATVKASL